MENPVAPEIKPVPTKLPLPTDSKVDQPDAPKKKGKFKRPKPVVIVLVLIVIGLLVAAFIKKDLFVAATVNGKPISRLSIVRDLEKQGGKQTLDAQIEKKLIDAELLMQGATVTEEEINEALKKIEDQVVSQGGTLADALSAEGVTEEELREQISDQKKLEKILGDKLAVSDEELNALIKDKKLTPPEGTSEEDFKNQLREQLKQQKFQQEAQKWVSDLMASAKIKYYVEY